MVAHASYAQQMGQLHSINHRGTGAVRMRGMNAGMAAAALDFSAGLMLGGMHGAANTSEPLAQPVAAAPTVVATAAPVQQKRAFPGSTGPGMMSGPKMPGMDGAV